MGKKSKLYLHNLQTRDMKNAGNCKREAFKNSGSLPHPLWAPLSVKEQELLQGPAWRQREKVLTQSQNSGILEFVKIEILYWTKWVCFVREISTHLNLLSWKQQNGAKCT